MLLRASVQVHSLFSPSSNGPPCTTLQAQYSTTEEEAVFWLRVDPGLPVPPPAPPPPVPPDSAVSRVVGRSIRRWIWMPSPGPMWEMWLKLEGADISLERRSGFLCGGVSQMERVI